MSESSVEVFRMLETAKKGEGLVTRDTDVVLDGRPIQHALDEAGMPLLVFPMDKLDHAMPNLAGLSVSATSAVTPARLYLRCSDGRLRNQFAYFVDDVLHSLRSASNPGWNVCLEVIENWRELFRSPSSELLGIQAQAGLLAELRVLEAATSIDSKAWHAWVGHDRARHDFRVPGVALEVKSTLRHHQFAVTVHGFGQLEPPTDSRLYVYAERVEESIDEGSESLNSLVGRLTLVCPDKAKFFAALRSSGLEPARLGAYEAFRFSLLEQRLMVVDDEFPRIAESAVGSAFAAEIPEVNYAVNVASVPAIAVGADALTFSAKYLTSQHA